MTEHSNHKQTVRQSFTRQADAYATNQRLTDPAKVSRLVDASGAETSARVLEVGTGPGHVAAGFTEQCRKAVGLDLTDAPLKIAREKYENLIPKALCFVQGDAEAIPFEDDTFDVVYCRLTLHHLEEPADVLQQMSRVCRPNGTIAIEDLVVSEHPERAEYQNRFERLRNPAHVRALPLSELLSVVADAGMDPHQVRTDETVTEVEEWLQTAETPKNRSTDVREMLSRDVDADLSGTRPFWRNDTLYFIHSTAIVIAQNLE